MSGDLTDERAQAMSKIKEVYDDGTATINGIDYVFTKATHKKRLKVFSYFTGIREQMAKQDFSFMGTDDFERIVGVIGDVVTVEGTLLSKKTTHWDEHPQNYLPFITMALGVISYPFLQGGS